MRNYLIPKHRRCGPPPIQIGSGTACPRPPYRREGGLNTSEPNGACFAFPQKGGVEQGRPSRFFVPQFFCKKHPPVLNRELNLYAVPLHLSQGVQIPSQSSLLQANTGQRLFSTFSNLIQVIDLPLAL